MSELKVAGFTDRDEPSTKMGISNYEYLHTGDCLANASKQSQKVYKSLIKYGYALLLKLTCFAKLKRRG